MNRVPNADEACPSCIGVKDIDYKDIDATFKSIFEAYFKSTAIVGTQITADYTISGQLVNIEKNSLAQVLIMSIFAPALRYDHCIWWFKTTNNKTGKTILTYQLFAFGPQERNLVLSFASMVNKIQTAAECMKIAPEQYQ